MLRFEIRKLKIVKISHIQQITQNTGCTIDNNFIVFLKIKIIKVKSHDVSFCITYVKRLLQNPETQFSSQFYQERVTNLRSIHKDRSFKMLLKINVSINMGFVP